MTASSFVFGAAILGALGLFGAGCGGEGELAFGDGAGAGAGAATGTSSTADTTGTGSTTSSTDTTSGSAGSGGGGEPAGGSGGGGAGAGGGGGEGGAGAAGGSGGAGAAGGGTTTTGAGGMPQPAGCVTDVAPGHHVFPCAGDIDYDVEIPKACGQGGCGLVVDMHGFTMSAASEEANTGMRALGQKQGYVVVQPTAPGLPPSWDQNAHAPLVHAFLKDAVAALAVDPKRVHAMGFSQGGGMTWRLLCQHAEQFASVSPIGGLEGCAFEGQEMPSEEVPILQVHGRKDAIVGFGVGEGQRDAVLAAWPFDAGVLLEDDGAHKATRYTTASGTRFEFWEHDYQAQNPLYGGHCFPGSSDKGFLGFACQQAGTFTYGELAMAFFIAHPKQ